ncbi:hypothetical protein [Streptomyces sp. SM10]|uniref:hypothetical protein n=1 Tax=Streptomyces sp. SM10 TaxID=565556 RepID=UPI0015E1916F|nr:hypothetical protein [Streptomyces sp. SM10]
MSKTATSSRPVLTGIDTSGAYPVHYRFSHAKSGNRHLVVVFANFSAPDDYGWSNGVFDNVRANILWVRDMFDGKNSYYLCKDMDFELERSVITLISNVMHSLGLTPDQCTMWGGSKGGSAALHFGLKYGFRNIVAIVPMFRIGISVQKRPAIADFMMGGQVTDDRIEILDRVIPDLVRAEANPRANLYLLSSPQDENYGVQVEPFLPLFRGYENFNFVYSDSPFITDHTTVTRRNVPALMGLLNLLVDGIAPRIGFVTNGHEQPDVDRSGIDSYLKSTSQVRESFSAPVVVSPSAGERVADAKVRFAGTARGAVRLSFWEKGKYVGSPPVSPDGSWSWTRDRAWSKGEHTVRMFAVDADGFHSPRAEATFTVTAHDSLPFGTEERIPPQERRAPAPPTISYPAPGQHVTASEAGVAGYAEHALHVTFAEGGVSLGSVPVSADGSWSWSPGWSWLPGPHTVDCYAVDAEGVASRGSGASFQVAGAAEPLQAQAPTGYFR